MYKCDYTILEHISVEIIVYVCSCARLINWRQSYVRYWLTWFHTWHIYVFVSGFAVMSHVSCYSKLNYNLGISSNCIVPFSAFSTRNENDVSDQHSFVKLFWACGWMWWPRVHSLINDIDVVYRLIILSLLLSININHGTMGSITLFNFGLLPLRFFFLLFPPHNPARCIRGM